MRGVRRLALVLLACLVVSSLFAAPALAQADDELPIDVPDEYQDDVDAADGEDADADDADETDDEEATDEDEDEDEDDATPQITGGDAIGGGAPSAGDLLDGTAEWAGDAAINVIGWVIEETLELTVGAPTMDNAGWLGIFGEPTSEPFATLFDDLFEAWMFPLTLSFVGMMVLVTGGTIPFSGFIGQYRASRWVSLTVVLIFAVALSWPLVSAMHLLSDTIGTSLAPSADELLGTEQGLQTLGTASIPAAGGLYIFGWIKVMIYALIYGMRYFLLMMVMPYVFPVALSFALAAPSRRLRAFGSSILWLHIGLLIMSWPMALLWRGAYLIDWGFGVGELGSILMVIGAIVAGVVIPVYIAYQMTQLTGVVSGAVGGAASNIRQRDTYKPKTYEAAKKAPSRARDIGQSARKRAQTAANRVRGRAVTDGGQSRSSSSRPSSSAVSMTSPGSSRRNRTRSDNTQASRKRSQKKRLRLTQGEGGAWRVTPRDSNRD